MFSSSLILVFLIWSFLVTLLKNLISAVSIFAVCVCVCVRARVRACVWFIYIYIYIYIYIVHIFDPYVSVGTTIAS
jgi:hypothetical protein